MECRICECIEWKTKQNPLKSNKLKGAIKSERRYACLSAFTCRVMSSFCHSPKGTVYETKPVAYAHMTRCQPAHMYNANTAVRSKTEWPPKFYCGGEMGLNVGTGGCREDSVVTLDLNHRCLQTTQDRNLARIHRHLCLDPQRSSLPVCR